MSPRTALMQKLPYMPYYLTTEERADHLLSAIDAAGYAVVPKEPTEKMIVAVAIVNPHIWEHNLAKHDLASAYRAMIEAAKGE